MEQLCFKDSFESCVHFNNLLATAQIATDCSVDKNRHDDNKGKGTVRLQNTKTKSEGDRTC